MTMISWSVALKITPVPLFTIYKILTDRILHGRLQNSIHFRVRPIIDWCFRNQQGSSIKVRELVTLSDTSFSQCFIFHEKRRGPSGKISIQWKKRLVVLPSWCKEDPPTDTISMKKMSSCNTGWKRTIYIRYKNHTYMSVYQGQSPPKVQKSCYKNPMSKNMVIHC